MFDKLILLADGQVAYFGPVKNSVEDGKFACLEHFEVLGYPCPEDSNAIEHIMKVVSSDVVVGKGGKEAALKAMSQNAFQHSTIDVASVPSKQEKEAHFDSSLYDQVCALVSRELLVRSRSVMLTKAVIGRTFVVSFLLGTVYWQIPIDQQGVFSINGCISFVGLNAIFMYAIGQAVVLPLQLPAVKRESQSNMYPAQAWLMSKFISDIPYDTISTFALCTLVFWSVGFRDEFDRFVFFFLYMWLTAVLAASFGAFVGVVSPNEIASLPLIMLFLFPMFLFSGLLLNFQNTPDYLLWLQYISVFFYTFRIMAVNQWDDFGAIGCSAADLAAPFGCAFKTGEDVLSYFDIDQDDLTRDLIVIFAMILFLRLMSVVVLTKKTEIQVAKAPAGGSSEDPITAHVGIVDSEAVEEAPAAVDHEEAPAAEH